MSFLMLWIDNPSAFRRKNLAPAMAGILREVAESMDMGEMPEHEGWQIDDVNGKPVGKAFYHPEKRDRIHAVK